MENRKRKILAWVLSFSSGLILFAAFPPIGSASLGFIGLIPFLWSLSLYPQAKLRLAYLAGLVFWIPSLWFLSPVTIPGALTLAAYCAVYWIPMGWAWGRFLEQTPKWTFLRSVRWVLGGAAWWCLFEWIRSWFLTGFPWNEMAVSQWENIGLLQIASIGGTGLLSFLLVSMNLGLGVTLMGIAAAGRMQLPKRNHPELYLPIILLVVAFRWGWGEMNRLHPETVENTATRITAIQPNSENKWSAETSADNYRVLWELTDSAMSLNPDLVVWPETAVPEELRYSPTTAALVRRLTVHEVPLLIGSLDFEHQQTPEGDMERIYYNSSFLISPKGELVGEYRKQHLVMFGEYMPFVKILPFLRSLTPMPEDVTPGELPGVIPFEEQNLRLGMLICFEDLLPHLARDRVKDGADVFVNQTNDAWFDPLWGSRAHLAHAVFRSVEQRKPTVRVTNSGVSAWIDVRGVVRETLAHPVSGEVRTRGFQTFDVEIPERNGMTFYGSLPLFFPILWFLLSGLLFLPSRRPVHT